MEMIRPTSTRSASLSIALIAHMVSWCAMIHGTSAVGTSEPCYLHVAAAISAAPRDPAVSNRSQIAEQETRAQIPSRAAEKAGISIELVSCDFEPSLWRRNTDIQNW